MIGFNITKYVNEGFLNTFFLQNVLNVTFQYFPLVIQLACLFSQLIILLILYKKTPLRGHSSFWYLGVILLTGIFTNMVLIVYLLGQSPFNLISERIYVTFFRMEVATSIIQFYVLLNFFRDLSSREKSSKFLNLSNILFVPTFLFVGYFLFIAFQTFMFSALLERRTFFYNLIVKLHNGYLLFLGFLALIIAYRNYRREGINILKTHIGTLTYYFILPYFFVKILESDFLIPPRSVNFPAATITSVLLTGMLYYVVGYAFS